MCPAARPFDSDGLCIRDSRDADLGAIHRIYSAQVISGLATFEEVAPEPGELARRRAALAEKGFPWLVCEHEGQVIGFAYAGPFRLRSAYRFTVEDSIYVDPAFHGRGAGSRLLGSLMQVCTALEFRQMVAIIGDSGNTGSIALHKRLGFAQIAVLRNVGFKQNRWIDNVIMQAPLGEGESSLADADRFPPRVG